MPFFGRGLNNSQFSKLRIYVYICFYACVYIFINVHKNVYVKIYKHTHAIITVFLPLDFKCSEIVFCFKDYAD